ncbi:MAG: family 43 glycosylhydrolase [Bacteroidales bacterium]
MKKLYLLVSSFLIFINCSFAQNPIIRDQYSADPSARVFNGRVYLYPSHDILAVEGKGRPGWFCMADYHVFSSENLTAWIDHGIIVSQNHVNWADSTAYSMWAPDCIEKNGKYYFYFPAIAKEANVNGKKGFAVGVAVSDKPEGPFIPQPEPVKGVKGIDPNVFVDKDGQAYLFWALGKIFAARLKDNMLDLDSEPVIIEDIPAKGLVEGPFLFERNGKYYMSYPHVQDKIERIEYAMGDNPMGPFKFAGVIMDESPMNCWTNQQSFVEYNGQWYLFYHQNAYSPKFDKNRSVCVDSLFFNADGTIRKVTPTLRGTGVTNAFRQIEIDRYSCISPEGVSVDFLDTLNTFRGWKTIFHSKNAWIQYNAVDFGKDKLKSVQVNASSAGAGILQIRLDNASGPIISEVKTAKSSGWNVVEARVSKFLPGIHNMVVVSGGDEPVEVDWIRFK